MLLSFAKNMGKNVSNKQGQKLFDSAKKSKTNPIKTASKRIIQKTAESTSGLIGNKIADKTTSISKTSTKEKQTELAQRTQQKKIYISRRKTANY